MSSFSFIQRGFFRASLPIFAVLFLFATARPSLADDFLDPEQAFKVEAHMAQPGMAEVSFLIADGYYLYRDRIKIVAEGASLGEFQLPPGKVKFDETFQKEVETYRGRVVVNIPVQVSADFVLKLARQGCADQGLCYPPMETSVKLSAVASASPNGKEAALLTTELDAQPKPASTGTSDSYSISKALKSGKLIAILPLFFLLGLGLAFTPCVLPMVPILSFIIVGEGVGIKRSRGFFLSLSYALGMALVYTALGVAAGLIGEGLAATLQNPWVLGAFAVLMAGLSLSMFGVYQLQVPGALQTKLTVVSEGQRNGKLIGVFLMGAISALIVGPCVAAPLAGALVYISQTRDVLVGGSALFAMAMGMSVPLLLMGISAGSLLPRAGAWMEAIKRFFGVLMLAMALWMVSPVIPAWAQMAGWAALLLGYAGYQLFIHRGGLPSKVFAVTLALLGLSQLIGVSTGGRDVYAPVAHLFGAPAHTVNFKRIGSLSELNEVLLQSKGQVVMLDFYADWCVSCKEMEKLTFSDAQVKAKLDKILLLQVDVTANNAQDKELLKRFNLFGPPGIIFFDKQGRELIDARVIGYQNVEKFLTSLQALGSI
ncbi:protein-disulfide reductase DsbD [Undibacterium sp.]|uniref:protein-disulfide reductase DsbD n=1 Tax=Undibacterium sp. TaxID=1914977 RepID=UPI0025EC732F|nr:protein-disulfide reductase DsbD [Undibacterium sp.]